MVGDQINWEDFFSSDRTYFIDWRSADRAPIQEVKCPVRLLLIRRRANYEGASRISVWGSRNRVARSGGRQDRKPTVIAESQRLGLRLLTMSSPSRFSIRTEPWLSNDRAACFPVGESSLNGRVPALVASRIAVRCPAIESSPADAALVVLRRRDVCVILNSPPDFSVGSTILGESFHIRQRNSIHPSG